MIPELRTLTQKLYVANAEADIVCNCDHVMELSVGPEIEELVMKRYNDARDEIIESFGVNTAGDMCELVVSMFEKQHYGRGYLVKEANEIRTKHDITKEDESFILNGE